MLTKLEQKFDHEKLLKIYNSLSYKHSQIHISSTDGKTYLYESGDLRKYNLNQNDFTQINSFFKGTYVETVYKELDMCYSICRGRFMTLTSENRAYSYHYDMTKRIHIPLVTHEDCMFIVDDTVYKMPELGQAYMLDTTKKHTALNLGWDSRVHLVVCLK